jgi:hypothetical protein
MMSLYSTKFTGDVKRLCRDGDVLDSKCEWASSAVHMRSEWWYFSANVTEVTTY